MEFHLVQILEPADRQTSSPAGCVPLEIRAFPADSAEALCKAKQKGEWKLPGGGKVKVSARYVDTNGKPCKQPCKPKATRPVAPGILPDSDISLPNTLAQLAEGQEILTKTLTAVLERLPAPPKQKAASRAKAAS